MTPQEIAARLTPAQRAAMVKMPGGYSQKTCAMRLSLFLEGLQTYGKLTPLGQAVRAIIEQEDSRNA